MFSAIQIVLVLSSIRATPSAATGLQPASQQVAVQPGPIVDAASAKQAQKTVQALVNAIRYGKASLAERYLGFATMGQTLLGDAAQKMDATQRQQFDRDLRTLLLETAITKGKPMFAYLDAVLFSAPQSVEGQLHLASTIVVHRSLKKVEIPVEWVLVREGSALKIVDVISMQESTCKAVREEEVLPLLAEGGPVKLLSAMQERLRKAGKTPAPS